MTMNNEQSPKNKRFRHAKRKLPIVVSLLLCAVLLTPLLYIKNIDSSSLQAPEAVPASIEPSMQAEDKISETAHKSKYLILVNKEYGLDKDYVPDDLVTVNPDITTGGENQLSKAAADALKKLIAAAEEEGHTIRLVSGYRSYSLQKSIFENNVAKSGREVAETYSAPPGHSEHQSGLAADVSSPCVGYDLIDSYGEEPEGIWLAENAYKFGFIIRYQKNTQDITGYVYEPWHIRYVGTGPGEEIYKRNITFEEYLGVI